MYSISPMPNPHALFSLLLVRSTVNPSSTRSRRNIGVTSTLSGREVSMMRLNVMPKR